MGFLCASPEWIRPAIWRPRGVFRGSSRAPRPDPPQRNAWAFRCQSRVAERVSVSPSRSRKPYGFRHEPDSVAERVSVSMSVPGSGTRERFAFPIPKASRLPPRARFRSGTRERFDSPRHPRRPHGLRYEALRLRSSGASPHRPPAPPSSGLATAAGAGRGSLRSPLARPVRLRSLSSCSALRALRYRLTWGARARRKPRSLSRSPGSTP